MPGSALYTGEGEEQDRNCLSSPGASVPVGGDRHQIKINKYVYECVTETLAVDSSRND